jgi:hypothetical protein
VSSEKNIQCPQKGTNKTAKISQNDRDLTKVAALSKEMTRLFKLNTRLDQALGQET